jgi:hypothetical protein
VIHINLVFILPDKLKYTSSDEHIQIAEGGPFQFKLFERETLMKSEDRRYMMTNNLKQVNNVDGKIARKNCDVCTSKQCVLLWKNLHNIRCPSIVIFYKNAYSLDPA